MTRRKTQEEFVKEVYELVGEEYEVIGEYLSCSKKIMMKHLQCHNSYEVIPKSFFKGSRCQKCSVRIRKTNEQFKAEVYNIVNCEYIVLEDYKGSKKKILFEHVKCRNRFSMNPNNFLSGERCPKCARNYKRLENKKNSKTYTKRDTNVFKKEIEDKYGGEYTLLSSYKNNKTKVKMRHNNCSHIYEVLPSNFLRDRKCPKCSLKKKTKLLTMSHEEFCEKLKDKCGLEYSVIGKYINSSTKIKIKHIECGYVYGVTPNNLLRNRKCPICSKADMSEDLRKDPEAFKKEVFDLVGDEYSILNTYLNSKTKVLMMHNNCKNEWEVQPNSFLRGTRCPKCVESSGEKEIYTYLNDKNIGRVSQHGFDDCKNIKVLPFDFYILNKILMEYDGGQHFYAVDFFGGKKKFINQLKNDKIKNQYCIDNNIPLIRIPYWEQKNIETILESTLMHYNIIPKTDSYDYSLIAEWIVDSEWDHDEYIAKCPEKKKEVLKRVS